LRGCTLRRNQAGDEKTWRTVSASFAQIAAFAPGPIVLFLKASQAKLRSWEIIKTPRPQQTGIDILIVI
jgi:hypothetical protein